jgi:hypothetical protein
MKRLSRACADLATTVGFIFVWLFLLFTVLYMGIVAAETGREDVPISEMRIDLEQY